MRWYLEGQCFWSKFVNHCSYSCFAEAGWIFSLSPQPPTSDDWLGTFVYDWKYLYELRSYTVWQSFIKFVHPFLMHYTAGLLGRVAPAAVCDSLWRAWSQFVSVWGSFMCYLPDRTVPRSKELHQSNEDQTSRLHLLLLSAPGLSYFICSISAFMCRQGSWVMIEPRATSWFYVSYDRWIWRNYRQPMCWYV